MDTAARLAVLEAQLKELPANYLPGTSADVWWLVSSGLMVCCT